MWQEDMHLAICGKTKTDYYFAILHFTTEKQGNKPFRTASFKL